MGDMGMGPLRTAWLGRPHWHDRDDDDRGGDADSMASTSRSLLPEPDSSRPSTSSSSSSSYRPNFPSGHPRAVPFFDKMWPRVGSRLLPRRLIFPALLVVIFVIQFGISLSDLPTVRIAQDIICIRTYGNTTLAPGHVPEDWCHADDVQSELNTVAVGLLVSQTLGGALVALPFGFLSDRVGRVFVLALVALGLLASQAWILGVLRNPEAVPLQVLWASGAFLLIGGGWTVAEAVVFAMISDIASEKLRATYFQWIACAVLAAQLAAQPASGGLMTVDPWLPMYLTLILVSLGGLLALLFIPETRGWNPPPQAILPPSRPLASAAAAAAAGPIIAPSEGDGHHHQRHPTEAVGNETPATPLGRSAVGIAATPPSMWTVFRSLRNPQLLLLVPATALSVPLVSSQIDVLFRLMPISFDWSLGESALLVSLRSAVTIAVIGGLLPLARWLLTTRRSRDGLTVFAQDLRIAQASAIVLTLGAFLTVFLFHVSVVLVGVVLSSLGASVPMLCRSLIVGLVRGRGTDDHVGGLFGGLAILETVAYVVFQLGFGALFNVGLGGRLGWPFFAALMVSIFFSTCLLFVKEPAGQAASEAETTAAAVEDGTGGRAGTPADLQRVESSDGVRRKDAGSSV